jgi:hypothetical protein
LEAPQWTREVQGMVQRPCWWFMRSCGRRVGLSCGEGQMASFRIVQDYEGQVGLDRTGGDKWCRSGFAWEWVMLR